MTQQEANNKPIPFPRDHSGAWADAHAATGSIPPTIPPHNLPTFLTPFIGRQEQVREVSALLLDESVRLLSLTGPGGVGKTRLALRVAEENVSNFDDGACFVALAPVSDPELVVPTIAQALGLKEDAGLAIGAALRNYLRDRGMLLVLDNFEQVTRAAVEVASILAAAPGVQVIVTTRASLHLYGEYEYPVPGMALPGSEEDAPNSIQALAQYEAIEFFVARSHSTRPDFRLTSANAPAVAELCRRLDGLPLALELAAARMRIFSPRALMARMERTLPLLGAGPADAPERHGTLRNAIAWSYNLLSSVEQTLFASLSVFAAGCTLEAAEHIAAGSGLEEGRLLHVLESLIDKNLLRQREQDDGEPRFWMLQTIREYALEKLEETGNYERARLSHAEFFLALAERAKPHLRGSEQEEWFSILERDQDNYRAALSFLVGNTNRVLAVRLIAALGWFWYVRGHFTEGRRWFDRALSTLPGSVSASPGEMMEQELSWWSDAYRLAGGLAFMQSDNAQATVFTRQSLEIARKMGDPSNIARSLNNLSVILSQEGELKQARSLLEESLELKRQTGTPADIAVALSNLAGNFERMGEYERAHTLNEEAIAITLQTGDKIHLSNRIHMRGLIALRAGKLDHALAAFRESLLLAREVGFKTGELAALYELGGALCDDLKSDEAQAVLEEAHRLAREQGDLTGESSANVGLGRVALIRGEHERARDLLRQALRLNIQLKEYSPSTVEAIEWLATVEAWLARQGNSPSTIRSAMLLGAATARREAMGTPVSAIWRKQHEQTAESICSLLGSDAFSSAQEHGRSLPFAEAVALGVQDSYAPENTRTMDDEPQTVSSPQSRGTQEVTARELEVLSLIASGLTNKEIAERLTLSYRTVEAHLYSIFNKLDVTTRSAATRYALDHGLARESR